MSEGLREMMANRRFAIPLVILLAFCFIGLILVGIVLLLNASEAENGTPVAQTTATTSPLDTVVPSSTPQVAASSTPRPSPTLVPLGTEDNSESAGTPVSGGGTSESDAGTPVSSAATEEPTAEATATLGAAAEATATPQTEEELAETGLGWGLILFSGVGLAMLVLVFRRLRLAQ